MSYQVDYIHLRNLIVRAIESMADASDEEDISESYGDLIAFLEDMYLNSVLTLVGSMLAKAKFEKDPKVVTAMLLGAREILELPPVAVKEALDDKYQELIKAMNLPDVYQVKTHNEQVVEDVIAESKQPDSQ